MKFYCKPGLVGPGSIPGVSYRDVNEAAEVYDCSPFELGYFYIDPKLIFSKDTELLGDSYWVNNVEGTPRLEPNTCADVHDTVTVYSNY